MTFPPLPPLKLVLDLATPEGCKAELEIVNSKQIKHYHVVFAAQLFDLLHLNHPIITMSIVDLLQILGASYDQRPRPVLTRLGLLVLI